MFASLRSNLFEGATAFNSDVSKWDTAKVTTMDAMFKGATAFDSDVSKWSTAQVTSMTQMFVGASKFHYDLRKWRNSTAAFDNTKHAAMLDCYEPGSECERNEVVRELLEKWFEDQTTVEEYFRKIELWDTSEMTDME